MIFNMTEYKSCLYLLEYLEEDWDNEIGERVEDREQESENREMVSLLCARLLPCFRRSGSFSHSIQPAYWSALESEQMRKRCYGLTSNTKE